MKGEEVHGGQGHEGGRRQRRVCVGEGGGAD